MLAAANTWGVVLLALGVALVLSAAFAFASRRRTSEQGPDIPAGMAPGPSDPALETNLLQKLQGWGFVLVAFFVIWIPLTWLREPAVNAAQEVKFKTEAIERGELAVLPFSEENQGGVGCVRCHGPELRGGTIQSGEGFAQPPDLTDICAGNLGNHALITSTEDIYQVVEEGRAAMPSWSIRYEGALNDQQINDIVLYLVEMSSEHVPFEDNVCINPEAQDRAEIKAAEAGTVLERP
jgi:mono/diheme cytochrome c family protein